MIRVTRDLIMAVISVKLNLDYDDVRIIADIIDNLLT
jgi:hypothetical protein